MGARFTGGMAQGKLCHARPRSYLRASGQNSSPSATDVPDASLRPPCVRRACHFLCPEVEAPATLPAAEINAVKAVDAAFAAAMNAKDSTAVFAVYATDAKVMPEGSPILEGAAGRAALTGMIAAGASDFVLTSTTTEGVGDLAYQVGTATFKIGGVTESVKYSEILRKGTGRKWRFAVDMFSSVAPPTPLASTVKK